MFATTPVKDLLSGNTIVDFTMDDMINSGGLADLRTAFSSSIPLAPFLHSGKGAVKVGPSVPILPKLLFVALSDVGKVDVLELGTGKLIATISVPVPRSAVCSPPRRSRTFSRGTPSPTSPWTT